MTRREKMNEKEKYVTPELEIIQLDEVDILEMSYEPGGNETEIMM